MLDHNQFSVNKLGLNLALSANFDVTLAYATFRAQFTNATDL